MGPGKSRPKVSVEGCTGGRGQPSAFETARGQDGVRAVVQDKIKGVSRVQAVQALNAKWAGSPWCDRNPAQSSFSRKGPCWLRDTRVLWEEAQAGARPPGSSPLFHPAGLAWFQSSSPCREACPQRR